MGQFGPYFKDLRKSNRITLREFCREAEEDIGNWSKVERGLLPPPQDHEVLAFLVQCAAGYDIAGILDVVYRLAENDKDIEPRACMTEEELVRALPRIFCSLRDGGATREDLEGFIEKISRS